MGRGRKSISNFKGSDWESVFYNSVGYFVKIINQELSKEYKLEPLSNHIKIIGGYAFKNAQYQKNGVPIIRISDFSNERIDLKDVVYYKEKKTLEKYELYENEIVIALTGGTIAKLAIVQGGLGKLYLNQHVGKFEVLKPNEFESEYVYWIARSVQNTIKNLAWGAAIPNVSPKEIEALKFSFPKRSIQQGIIQFLNDLKNNDIQENTVYFNEEIENSVIALQLGQVGHNTLSLELSHQLHLVKKLRQQLLQDAVQGKLVEQNPNDGPASVLLQKIKAEKEQHIKDKKLKKEKELPLIKPEEIPFGIPENWVWCKFGEISEIKRGKGPIYSEKGIYKMLNQKCVRWFIIDNQYAKQVDQSWFNSLSDDFTVKKEDVLINSTGDGTIGRSAIADFTVEGFGFDSHILRMRSWVDQKFICYFINSEHGQNLVELTKGATSTKQTELGVNNLLNFVLPLPPLAEQHRIVQKLEQLMQTCDALEATIKQSQQQNEQLLQQVLREALTKEVEPTEKLIAKNFIEPKQNDKYKALLLGAEIIFQLHQKQTLGHIKLQKLIYLCDRTQEMNLPVNFLKWAMGPYDPELQKYIDEMLVDNQWFKYEEDASFKYQPLKYAGGHRADFDKYFMDHKVAINHLIQLFENAKSARIEIVATLFACWEDMITKNQLVNDNALLANFYNWSDKKKKHTTEKVINALRWMENQGITPK